MNKDKVMGIVVAIAFTVGVVALVFVFMQIIVGVNDQGVNKTETICDEIGLDVLSVSRQVFGDDYVVCYNEETNETRRIEI